MDNPLAALWQSYLRKSVTSDPLCPVTQSELTEGERIGDVYSDDLNRHLRGRPPPFSVEHQWSLPVPLDCRFIKLPGPLTGT